LTEQIPILDETRAAMRPVDEGAKLLF